MRVAAHAVRRGTFFLVITADRKAEVHGISAQERADIPARPHGYNSRIAESSFFFFFSLSQRAGRSPNDSRDLARSNSPAIVSATAN